MKKIYFILALSLCVVAPPSFAGPFGLDMGTPIDQIDRDASQASPYVYTTTNVPNPHSAFELYAIKASPRNGLCWVKAIGKDISTSSYGVELKSAFNDMKAALENTYGPNDLTDILLPGSIWDEPNDFMMSLVQKERYLMAIWEEEHGSSLKDNIVSIGLIASPNGTSDGYISIEYSFSNKEACDSEINSMEDSVL